MSFLALIAPMAAGLSITLMIGVLFIISGAAQFFIVFRAGSFGQGLLLALPSPPSQIDNCGSVCAALIMAKLPKILKPGTDNFDL